MLERKNNIYILIILLSSLASCSINRSVVSEQESIEVLLDIYESLTRHPHSMGYRLNRQVCFNDSIIPYYYLHEEYKHYLTNGIEGTKTVTYKQEKLIIDFDKLLTQLRDTFYLPKKIHFSGREQEVPSILGTGYGDWFKTKGLNTYTFSPFVPTNQKNTFIVFVELERPRDKCYYFYLIRKIKKKYIWGELLYDDLSMPLMYSQKVDLLQEEYDRRYGNEKKKNNKEDN